MMERNHYKSRLASLGFDEASYFEQAFSRNIGIFSQEEQEKLAKTTVAIPGMGGVGGIYLITLVRSGVGRFHLADMDIFEPVNVNRQYGGKVNHLGNPKLPAMVDEALSINPYLDITPFPDGIGPGNLDPFLDGVDVVLDGLDFFAFDVRRALFNRARELGLHVVTAGPIGFSAAMLIFAPDRGMSFDDYFDVYDGLPDVENHLSFFLGLTPRGTHFKYMDTSKIDLGSKKGPSLNIGCQLCAGMAVTEAIRIVLGREGVRPVPHFFQFDAYRQIYRKGRLWRGNRNPVQRLKRRFVKRFVLRIQDAASTEIPPIPETSVPKGGPVPQDIIRYILRAGVQAPSGDNAQPWNVVIDRDSIELYLDPHADSSFFNVQQIASIISCGAVVENMVIAATKFGLDAQITLQPDKAKPDLMARVDLFLNQTEPSSLADSIWNRETNRKPYKKKRIPEELQDRIKSHAEAFEGCRIDLIMERKDLRKLARIVYKVDRIRTEHRPLHEHLMRMIRFSEREMYKERTGLPLKNLEAGLAGELFLRGTKSWKVMAAINRIGLGRMVPAFAYRGILASAGAALLTVEGLQTENFLRGGRGLERIWLELTRAGVSVQPMTAITLFWMRWRLSGKNDFSAKHQKLLESVWKDYQALFPIVESDGIGHVMLFRFGYASRLQQRTLRQALEKFGTPAFDPFNRM